MWSEREIGGKKQIRLPRLHVLHWTPGMYRHIFSGSGKRMPAVPSWASIGRNFASQLEFYLSFKVSVFLLHEPFPSFHIYPFRTLGPGRKILIAGDSLSRDFTQALICELSTCWLGDGSISLFPTFAWFSASFKNQNVYATLLLSTLEGLSSPEFEDSEVGRKGKGCVSFTTCGDHFPSSRVTIYSCFNIFLSVNQIPMSHLAPWAELMKRYKPSIVVLNRGTHYCGDYQFSRGIFHAMKYIREIQPHALVIYRSKINGISLLVSVKTVD